MHVHHLNVAALEAVIGERERGQAVEVLNYSAPERGVFEKLGDVHAEPDNPGVFPVVGQVGAVGGHEVEDAGAGLQHAAIEIRQRGAPVRVHVDDQTGHDIEVPVVGLVDPTKIIGIA